MGKVSNNQDSEIGIELKHGSLVEPENVEWIWDQWIARRKLHLIAGEPGTNKTTLTMAFAATISIAGRWPDGSKAKKPENVIVWSNEDDFEDTLLPRFIANGGDRSKFYFIHGVNNRGNRVAFDPSRHLGLLNRQIEKLGNVGLVIIDSAANVVNGDSHKNDNVRKSLQPLVDSAEKHNYAAMGVVHFNKGNESSNPLSRIVGSVGFGGMTRIAYATRIDPDNPNHRLLVRIKNNIGKNNDGFRCAIKIEPIPGYPHISSTHIEWMDELKGEARDLLGYDPMKSESKQSSRQSQAKDFLIKALTGVDMLQQDEIERLGDENGFSMRTLNEAKKAAKVISLRGNGRWYWKIVTDQSL